ncbi:hypothetical protein E2320_000843 [Naja naja]|nr:hypothetical protein E2320_000843 [Naja naja]
MPRWLLCATEDEAAACTSPSCLQVFENEWESDRESDVASDCFTEGSLAFCTGDPEPAALVPKALWGHSTPKPAQGCSAPVGDSSAADLEWDPSVDVGGSTSQDEDSSYYSAVMDDSDLEPIGHFSSVGITASILHSQQCDPADSITHVDKLPPAKELQHPLQIQTRGQKVHRWSRKKGKQNLITGQLWSGKEQRKKLKANAAFKTCCFKCDLQLPKGISTQSKKLCRASVLWLLLSTTFAVLVWLLCQSSFLPLSQPRCLQTNGFAKSFHLMLKYEGPPPT